MNAPEEKDPLDALLREQSAYVDDDGFTARVIAALPQHSRHSWLQPAILLGAAAVGSVLAIRWLPWESLPPLDFSALFSLDFQALMPWMTVFLVMASILWTVMAAIQWDD
jgi:hypothetical protein